MARVAASLNTIRSSLAMAGLFLAGSAIALPPSSPPYTFQNQYETVGPGTDCGNIADPYPSRTHRATMLNSNHNLYGGPNAGGVFLLTWITQSWDVLTDATVNFELYAAESAGELVPNAVPANLIGVASSASGISGGVQGDVSAGNYVSVRQAVSSAAMIADFTVHPKFWVVSYASGTGPNRICSGNATFGGAWALSAPGGASENWSQRRIGATVEAQELSAITSVGTPVAALGSLQFSVESNLTGTAYYLVIPAADPEPSPEQVKSPGSYSGGTVAASGTIALTANTPETITAYGLANGTDYRIVAVTEAGVVALAGATRLGRTSSAEGTTLTAYRFGGTISGLQAGFFVEISERGVPQGSYRNGSYGFYEADGYEYDIDLAGVPLGHQCTLSEPSAGTLQGADVGNIDIVCVADPISVGGSLDGLAPGNRVTLRMDYQPPFDPCGKGAATCKQASAGSEDLPLDGNGGFGFATALNINDTYSVDVAPTGQPASPYPQTCTVTGPQVTKAASGIIGTVDVGDISVACAPAYYTLGGQVSGLADGARLVLQNNGGDDLPITANGAFTFPTLLADGSSFQVSVLSQPDSPTQVCSLVLPPAKTPTFGPGEGSIAGGNVSDLRVECVTSEFQVGGQVSGLLPGYAVGLSLNGGAEQGWGNGAYAFNLADGASYAITLASQPEGHQCALQGPTEGTLAGASIDNVDVVCSPLDYRIGGSVGGLAAGATLTLRNQYAPAPVCGKADKACKVASAGSEDLVIDANGSFAFATRLNIGDSFSVEVAVQPTAPAQTCTLGRTRPDKAVAGTVGSADVLDLVVDCVIDATAPEAPTDVRIDFSGSRATVRWTPPQDDGGSPITGYRVELQPGGLSCEVSGTPPPTQCEIVGVAPGVNYVASVTASNAVGAGSAGAGSGTGVIAAAPEVIPADQPWALALLGLLLGLLGARGLLRR